MSPSEISFLVLGLVLGAALGAALAQVVRARPAPRREIRLTITPNAIPPRRSLTLSVPRGIAHPGLIPGSPEAGALAHTRTIAVATGPARTPSGPAAAAQPRTPVPSAPVMVPVTAVAVPVGETACAPARATRPSVALARPSPIASPQAGARTSAMSVAAPTAVSAAAGVAVMDAPDRPREAEPRAEGLAFITLVRPRPPVVSPRPTPAASAVPVTARPAPVRAIAPVARPALAPPSGPTLTRPRAGSQPSGLPGPQGAATAPGTATDPCAGQRRAVEERCALADVAREQARRAADTLREAQRAYDTLRERVDRASDQADPRQVAAAKDRLHAAFRAASDQAGTADATEAAARAWLNEINALNSAVREAQRIMETGSAEQRTRLAALERLSGEADAARIAGENAQAGCRAAREDLAGCEEADTEARRRAAVAPEPAERHPFAGVWPEDSPDLPDAPRPSPADLMAGLPAIVRVLRGDREARDRLVATLAAGDPESARDWQLRVSRLVDAIMGRAIEDGYLDLPDDDPFWRLFSHRECRDIVSALSALGFRFDGMGGFADGRAPAARDLSLAVGYAGLDRMRIRTWPRDAEIAVFYERAVVSADEWLADQAGDLSLGRMVDALGRRAADLSDVWNAWGRVRPALLSG